MTEHESPHPEHAAWHVVHERTGRVAPTPVSTGIPTNDAAGLEREADAMGARAIGLRDETAVSNAGLVLLAPFLPQLFARCDLTAGDGFKSPEAAARGAYLLHAIALERPSQPTAAEWALPALLAGIPGSAPPTAPHAPNATERAVQDACLHVVIETWQKLHATSIATLRATFLQRPGKLARRDDAWLLQVEHKSFDVLLASIPWGISTVKYPWMPQGLFVEW